ncbi:unnamed protein product [Tetraodon nigroviridis]|uniref:Chromosome 2 SCAF15010, whole genome shotgun sequence n=1 Tax=Tetraodon nigroviridis TaxID=99883 RepID=Q4RNT2_TETNG|nr:unnamed protein product [Tetraodon nigroviridis]
MTNKPSMNMRELVAGALPRWSGNNPEDEGSKKHQNHPKDIDENCLWGRILILGVAPAVQKRPVTALHLSHIHIK